MIEPLDVLYAIAAVSTLVLVWVIWRSGGG